MAHPLSIVIREGLSNKGCVDPDVLSAALKELDELALIRLTAEEMIEAFEAFCESVPRELIKPLLVNLDHKLKALGNKFGLEVAEEERDPAFKEWIQS